MGDKQFDNAGFEVGAPESGHPVLGSGFTLHASNADTDYTASVSCGETLRVVCNAEGPLLLGITGAVTTVANREWVVPANGVLKLTIPEQSNAAATVSLHFGAEKSECIGYGVQLDIN